MSNFMRGSLYFHRTMLLTHMAASHSLAKIRRRRSRYNWRRRLPIYPQTSSKTQKREINYAPKIGSVGGEKRSGQRHRILQQNLCDLGINLSWVQSSGKSSVFQAGDHGQSQSCGSCESGCHTGRKESRRVSEGRKIMSLVSDSWCVRCPWASTRPHRRMTAWAMLGAYG